MEENPRQALASGVYATVAALFVALGLLLVGVPTARYVIEKREADRLKGEAHLENLKRIVGTRVEPSSAQVVTMRATETTPPP